MRYFSTVMMAFALLFGAGAADAADLVTALAKSKITLADGIRQAAKSAGAPLSARFEFDAAGRLSLSVYAAQKGLATPAPDNVLQELSGSPEQGPWRPEVDVFKDAAHIARSSQQLTLLSLTNVTLLDLVGHAEQWRRGTVFSVTPEIRHGQPVALVLVNDAGKVTELTYNLDNGALIQARRL
jgi:hypothetical protein